MRALFVAAFILLLAAPGMARAHTIVLRGISFSDELGGFVLEKVSGRGSIADPFVVVERLTDINGATLVFRAEPVLGNLIGSPDRIGFALVKVIKNETGRDWSSLEIELQSKLGVPSDHTDELSYGQGSTAGRPFTASAFGRVTLIDEPYDRIECEDGIVRAGAAVTLRFVVSQPGGLGEAFIAQRPGRPVAGRGAVPGSLAGIEAQRLEQGPEMGFEMPPASDRGAIEPPADLVQARRAHRAPGLVEGKAAVVPGQAAVIENRAQAAFEIIHQRFIAHLQQRPPG